MRIGGNWLPFLLTMLVLFLAAIGISKLFMYLRHKYKQRKAHLE